MTSLSFTISSRLGYVYCGTKRRRQAKIDDYVTTLSIAGSLIALARPPPRPVQRKNGSLGKDVNAMPTRKLSVAIIMLATILIVLSGPGDK